MLAHHPGLPPGAGPAFIVSARKTIEERAHVPGMRWAYVATQLGDKGDETILVVSFWEDLAAFGKPGRRGHRQRAYLGADRVSGRTKVEYFEARSPTNHGCKVSDDADPVRKPRRLKSHRHWRQQRVERRERARGDNGASLAKRVRWSSSRT